MIRGKKLSARSRLLVGIVCLAIVVPAGVAGANHIAGSYGIVGGFEVDGNFKFDHLDASATRDWQTFSTVPGGALVKPDPGDSKTDDIISGKEQDTSTWSYSTGKPPGKDDLTRVYFAKDSGTAASPKALLYLDFERLPVSGAGDAHANFELNQSRATVLNGNGAAVPVRTDGDLLVVYDYPGGTKPTQVRVQLRKWNATTSAWDLVACFPTVTGCPSLSAGQAFADINGSTVTRPPFNGAADPNGFGGGTVEPLRFGEVGLDLNSIFQKNVLSCPGFGSLFAKTRSSGESFNSDLQDKVGPVDINFSSCAKKNWSFTFSPKPIAGATVQAVYTLPNSSPITVPLSDTGHSGTFTGSSDNIPPDTSFTWHFEVKNATGQLIWSSPERSETLTAGQEKTNSSGLRYSIVLNPRSAENFAGQAHTLTATVTGGEITADSSADQPLPNVPVNFVISSSNPAGCASLSSTSGVTGIAGTVTTVLSSATACSAVVRAFINASGPNATAGYDIGEANSTASKTFVNYVLTVTPPTKVNEVNNTHDFLVTLTRNGSPVSGATVTLVLSTGTSDAHFTQINGAAASGTTANCTTRPDGTCAVTITATTAGEVKLTASFGPVTTSGATCTPVSNDDPACRSFSSDGLKHYVDANIRIDQSTSVNEVNTPHVFTVTFTAFPDGTGVPTFGPITTTLTGTPTGTPINTCGSPTLSESKTVETCTVTINSSTAGTFTLNASGTVTMGGVTVTRSTSGTSGTGGTGSAVKNYVDASIAVTPNSAVNEAGIAHVFTVTVHAFPAGTGTPTYAITTSLSQTPNLQNDSTCGNPMISTDGNTATCTVTINSSTPGTFTLNASADVTMGVLPLPRNTSGHPGPEGTGPGTKTYFTATINKVACPDNVPRGGVIGYTISFTVTGTTLTHAAVTDTLPQHVTFHDASNIGAVTPTATGGTVTWSFPTLAPGTYTGTIDVLVDRTAPVSPPALTNTVTLSADQLKTSKTATSDVTVNSGVVGSGGRAFGIQANVLNLVNIPATPDTNVKNPDQLLSVPNPLLPAMSPPLVSLLDVVNSTDGSGVNRNVDTAIASAANVDLNIPPAGIRVQATAVRAKSTSEATGDDATSTSAGSTIVGLKITTAAPFPIGNTITYGDISEPTTIAVTNPVTGLPIASVSVLEKTTTGAAHGDVQPNGGLFASGLAVNGIHVSVPGVADVIVSHADSSASFASRLGCTSPPGPHVSGRAVALDLFNVTPNLAHANVAEVILPSTGGVEDSGVIVGLPLDLGTVSAIHTHTEGQITDPEAAHSLAHVADLNLLGVPPAIHATLIEATSDTTLGGSSGGTTIQDLIIGPNSPICPTLCQPTPNTVLLLNSGTIIVMLNEQIPGDGSLTVNAVHIWIVGKGNPLGLPVGAEVVISGAHSDAHPAPPPTD